MTIGGNHASVHRIAATILNTSRVLRVGKLLAMITIQGISILLHTYADVLNGI